LAGDRRDLFSKERGFDGRSEGDQAVDDVTGKPRIRAKVAEFKEADDVSKR